MFYTANRPITRELDALLICAALLLLAFGLVMVYSASITSAQNDSKLAFSPTYYLGRHALYIAVALAAALLVFQVPMRTWQQVAPYLFVIGLCCLVVVLIPLIGREVKGARRWISFAGFQLQPSEFVKLAVVLYAADYTVRKAAFMHSFRKGFLPMLGVMFITGSLLLAEPDFGAFAVVAAISVAILFLGGLNLRLFFGMVVLLVVGFVLLIVFSSYRLKRVLGFLNPWEDPLGKGYQLTHALMAFGRGEWFGAGLGGSVEKLGYLPEAHTDFLLAVIAEELGFAGVLAVICAFAFIAVRAFAIGSQAAMRERYFAALVAQGAGIWIAAQAIINVGVNMGLLPTKGLTLPLMSYGGSALITTCAALGILLRVDYENRQLMKGREV
jgi:cell division protein FtsW